MIINLALEGHASELFEIALDRQARLIAGARLYDGTAAISEFRLTRAALRHIPETMLPGRTKPLYSARAIQEYLESRETPPKAIRRRNVKHETPPYNTKPQPTKK